MEAVPISSKYKAVLIVIYRDEYGLGLDFIGFSSFVVVICDRIACAGNFQPVSTDHMLTYLNLTLTHLPVFICF